MTNTTMLKQLRDSVKAKVKEDPTVIVIIRAVMVAGGPGGEMVEDPYNSTAQDPITVRLFHDTRGPEGLKGAPSGFMTNLQRAILIKHTDTVYENDIFEALGRQYKIGPVDPLNKFGGTYGYQAPIIDASEEETS